MLWLQVGQFTLSASIAAFVAWVAWQQWKTAREKLKLDLFDRRFAVFMDIRRIVSEGAQSRDFSDPALINEVFARARFLFGPEIKKQLEELSEIHFDIETGDIAARKRVHPWYMKFLSSIEPYLTLGT